MLSRCGNVVLFAALLCVGLFPINSGVAATGSTVPINLLLAWTDNSTGEDGFAVERSLSAGGPWIVAGYTAANSPAFLDTELRSKTTYYYRVTALGTNGTSLPSNILKIVTPSAARSPQVTTLVTRSVSVGETAVLAAPVIGNPPMQFQWMCNGTNIDGATAIALTLQNVRGRDAGNYSLVLRNEVGATTNTAVRLTVLAPITCTAQAGGVITPFVTGQKLEIGRRYKIGAVAQKGNAFRGWRINGTNATTARTLSFVMQEGFDFAASFADVTPPTLTVTSTKSGAKLKTHQLALAGIVRDNMVVDGVFYQLNASPWLRASGTTNWQAQLLLKPGLNTLRTFARDTTGNASRTNVMQLTLLATNPAVLVQPVLTGLRINETSVDISLQSIAGALYQLEYKSTLNDEQWTPLDSSILSGNGGLIWLTDADAPVSGRFYRAAVLQP